MGTVYLMVPPSLFNGLRDPYKQGSDLGVWLVTSVECVSLSF